MSSSFYPRRQLAARSREFAVRAPQTYVFSPWLALSLGVNVALAILLLIGWRTRLGPLFLPWSASANETTTSASTVPYAPTPPSQWINASSNGDGSSSEELELGPRHRWTYTEWVEQLEREAAAVANRSPDNLNILLGDSISLWFPHDLLPLGPTWLNQGISGEGTVGLLKRLDLISQTEPTIIYLMIGINDLIRDVGDDTVLANQQQIIQELKQMHPSATLVVQTILPHAGDRITWEGKEQLLAIPNSRIEALNRRLAIIAEQEEVEYLDLQPIFRNSEGNLRIDLTTDGLHLNDDGYRVWASALQMHQELSLAQ